MEVIYNWIISSMQEYPSTPDGLNDVVFIVNWRRIATTDVDGKVYSTDTFGQLYVPAPEPADFTPYPDLTFDQVCGWIEGILNVQIIDEQLFINLQDLINPPVIQLPLPWAPPEPII